MAMIQIGGCIRGIELTFANADQRYSRDTAVASTGLRPAFDQPSSQTRTHAAWRGLVAYTKQSRAPSQPQLQDPSSSLKNASPFTTQTRCKTVNSPCRIPEYTLRNGAYGVCVGSAIAHKSTGEGQVIIRINPNDPPELSTPEE